MLVAGGSTDVKTHFAMRKTSDGTAATGLTPADFDMQYVRSGEVPVAKVDATALAATDSAHADNKIIEIDATDQPGLYRADWPDAAFAAGVRETILTLKVATAFTEHLRVEIDGEVTAEALGTQAKADVNAEADTALTDIKLDHLIAAADGDDPVDGSIMAHLVSATEDWSTFVPSTDSLQAVRDHATTIKTDTAATLLDTGTDGVIVVTNNDKQGYNAMVDTTIASVTSQTVFVLTAGPGDNNALLNAVAVFFDADGDQSFRDVTAYTGSTLTITVDADPDFTVVDTDKIRIYPSAGAATAAEIADAVHDEARADHVIAGSFGEGVLVEDLNTAAKASVNVEVDGALNTAIPGSPTANSINERVKATDDKLPSATISDITIAQVNTECDTALTDTGIEADLDNATDGLGALKTLIDTVNTDLSNGTDGLGALKTLIDTVNTDLSNGTDGLGALKTLIDGIKTITDKFVFTVANEVDANVQSVNDKALSGDGSSGTPWGPV